MFASRNETHIFNFEQQKANARQRYSSQNCHIRSLKTCSFKKIKIKYIYEWILKYCVPASAHRISIGTNRNKNKQHTIRVASFNISVSRHKNETHNIYWRRIVRRLRKIYGRKVCVSMNIFCTLKFQGVKEKMARSFVVSFGVDVRLQTIVDFICEYCLKS